MFLKKKENCHETIHDGAIGIKKTILDSAIGMKSRLVYEQKNAAGFANKISWRKITITSLTEATVMSTANVRHERKQSLLWML